MAVETDERQRSETDEATDADERTETTAGSPAPLGATIGLAAVLGLAAAGAAVLLARRAERERGRDEGAEATGDGAAERERSDSTAADEPNATDDDEPAAARDETEDIPDAGNVPVAEREAAEDERSETEAAPRDGGDEEASAAGSADEPDGEEDVPSARRDDRAADSDSSDDREDPAGGDGAPPHSDAANLVQRAKEHIEELTGRQAESVSGLERADEGWRVTLELVELARVPSSTDVLATYELQLDDDGELVGYSRGRRYHRSQADAEASE